MSLPTLTALDSIEVAFALVAGDNVAGLYRNAWLAREKYDLVTSVGEPDGELPGSFLLKQNYPNPFNPITTIEFDIAVTGHVVLYIYNSNGQLVRTLVDEDLAPGQYHLQWNGLDQQDRQLASGLYLYKLVSGSFSQTKTMLLIK